MREDVESIVGAPLSGKPTTNLKATVVKNKLTKKTAGLSVKPSTNPTTRYECQ